MRILSVILSSLALSNVTGFAPNSAPNSRPSSTSLFANGGVVITGSAGGVGWAYAGKFMERGYDVVICDVKDCTAAAAALEQSHKGAKVFHTQCDVSDSESVQNLAQFAKEKLGTVTHWINNAGVNGGRRALSDVPISQVELVVKVSVS
jgi:NAD(P)-dependent dehydrogenase (short-subunit alcohol dehydrogenase family)